MSTAVPAAAPPATASAAGSPTKKKQIKVGAVNVIYSEVTDAMRDDAVAQASTAVATLIKGEYQHYWQLAKFLKEYFDKTYNGTWHVVVGESYGTSVTNEVSKYINIFHFYI